MVPNGLFERFLRICVPSVTQKNPKIVKLAKKISLDEKSGTHRGFFKIGRFLHLYAGHLFAALGLRHHRLHACMFKSTD
jgi:hypothetical protein